MSKKITVNKNDEPTLIAEKLIDTEEREVVFSIPRFSRFGESLSNFKLIKREAEVLDKEIFIESVDEEVINFATKAGIEAANPFLEQRRRRFSDIVAVDQEEEREVDSKKEVAEQEEEEEGVAAEVVVPVTVRKRHQDADQDPPPVKIRPAEEDKELNDPIARAQASLREWEVGEPTRPTRSKRAKRFAKPKFGFLKKKKIVAILGLAGLVILIYLGVAVLPRAKATIVTKKEPWVFDKGVLVDSSATTVNVSANTIPGQVFIKRDALTMKFPATGKKFVERKATGKLTIYNAHSSAKQSLVVNTRFETPEGLIFRLTSGVIVPGAKVQNGKIIPSSIEVDVVADSSGSEYNVGPVAKLTIPGFSGSDKFNDFYGELKSGTSGGFVGETQVPTEADLNTAKTESAATIEKQLSDQLADQAPGEFEILDTATKFTIFKQAVDANVGSDGKFTILTEAQLAALAFKKDDVESLMEANLSLEKEGAYTVWSDDLKYGVVSVQNPAAGQMTLPIKYEASLSKTIDISSLRTKMRGQSENNLRAIILSVPGVENANISLWPFWVKSVPDNENKINITVE